MKPTSHDVRRVLEQALGEGRLAGVPDDKPLLRAGVITSIESVSILLDLEKSFGVRIQQTDPAGVTIQSLTQAVGGEASEAGSASPIPTGRGYSELLGVARRPLLALLLILAWLYSIDAFIGFAIRTWFQSQHDAYLEHGRRLYPGSGALSQDDFRFAVAQHEITKAARPDARKAAFFGDSGTIGSFLEASESLPAQTEMLLNRANHPWQVFNLAWYARLLSKDLMLLDAVWDQRFDVAVFTVGDPYFDRSATRLWIDLVRHTSVNAPLYREFVQRVPPGERGPFEQIGREIEKSDRKKLGSLRRFEFDHFSFFHYQPFLFYLTSGHYLGPVFSASWHDLYQGRNERFGLEHPDAPLDLGAADNIDPSLVSMLRTTIEMLNRRGVKTVLLVQPAGPRERQSERSAVTALTISNDLSRQTGCAVVNARWMVPASEFLDNFKHYTPEGNRMLAAAVAETILAQESGNAR